jgi:xylulokinase
MDAWAGMFGLGVVADGQAMYLSGMSEVLGIVSARTEPTPGVIVFPPWRGLTLHAGPTQAGGASLDWLAGLLGRPAAALAQAAGGIGRTSPLFLPHLEGERAPLWDAGARGAFAGLTARTDPAALALAVMEGVAFSARLAFEALEHSATLRPAVIRAGGGGMRSDGWCQIRANALGRPLLRTGPAAAAALGAAVCAGVGSGLVPDLAAAASALADEGRRFDPEPAASALADERFETFRALYAQLRPINDRLA